MQLFESHSANKPFLPDNRYFLYIRANLEMDFTEAYFRDTCTASICNSTLKFMESLLMGRNFACLQSTILFKRAPCTPSNRIVEGTKCMVDACEYSSWLLARVTILFCEDSHSGRIETGRKDYDPGMMNCACMCRLQVLYLPKGKWRVSVTVVTYMHVI